MTAAELKQKLRTRHPATSTNGAAVWVGPWTCIEEYREIDLLAVSSYATPPSGGVPGVKYPRVGYEVKVSRSDYRRELLHPRKRKANVEWCNAFYFAVPPELLTRAELAFEQPPEFDDPAAYMREECPSYCYSGGNRWDDKTLSMVKCGTCAGRGYMAKSLVERTAPMLWVPPDVGLVEVGISCRVVKPSPVRAAVPALGPEQLGTLVRWVSARRDPRHGDITR